MVLQAKCGNFPKNPLQLGILFLHFCFSCLAMEFFYPEVPFFFMVIVLFGCDV